MCGVAGIILWICDARTLTKLVPFTVLTAKFGIQAAFSLLYMSTLYYFPSQFMGSIFGTCNVVARLCTIMSPMVAEAKPPTPVLTIIVTCFGATLLSRLLKEPKERA